MELFKEIPQYEGIYILSSNGYVKNIKTNRILKNKKATVFSISLKKGREWQNIYFRKISILKF